VTQDADIEEILRRVQVDSWRGLPRGCETSWTRSGKIGTLGAVGPPRPRSRSRQDGCAAWRAKSALFYSGKYLAAHQLRNDDRTFEPAGVSKSRGELGATSKGLGALS
jgi:hypothetical protein